MAVAAEVEELIDPDSRPALLAPTLVTGSPWNRWESGLSPEEVLALLETSSWTSKTGGRNGQSEISLDSRGSPLSLVNAAFGNAAPADHLA